mgnify:CR=1 FL=1
MELFIKICGITSLKDAKLAASFGANALGFMMYQHSSRKIDKINAARIIKTLPEEITPVMVFVNSNFEYVESCLKVSPKVIPQFHGTESPEFCSSFGRDFIKAIRVTKELDLDRLRNTDLANNNQQLNQQLEQPIQHPHEGMDWSLFLNPEVKVQCVHFLIVKGQFLWPCQ